MVFLATFYRAVVLYRTAEAGAALPLLSIIMRDGKHNDGSTYVVTERVQND